MLWLVVLCGMISLGQTQPLPAFPNIGYLGSGYDVFQGNPRATLDEGFRSKIVSLHFDTGRTTSDRHYSIPDEIEARGVSYCSYEAKTDFILGSQSYQNSLKTDVTIGGSVGIPVLLGAAFTASVGYKDFKQQSSTNQDITTSATATCMVYNAWLLDGLEGSSLSKEFQLGVSKLNTSFVSTPTKYFDFLTRFGTHYVNNVMMGGKAIQTTSFSRSSFTKMESWGVDVKVAASASFKGISGNTGSMTETETQQAHAFDKMKSKTTATYLGSKPPVDGKWESWADGVSKAPMPVQYKLSLITELLTDHYFPEDTKIRYKADNLTRAIAEWANKLGAETPKADPASPPPVKLGTPTAVGSWGPAPSDTTVYWDDMSQVSLLRQKRSFLEKFTITPSFDNKQIYGVQFEYNGDVSTGDNHISKGNPGVYKMVRLEPYEEYISQMEMSIDYSDKKVMGMVIATNLGKKTTIGEAEKFPMKMNLPSGYAIVGMNGGKLPASISNIAPIIHKVAQDNSSLFGDIEDIRFHNQRWGGGGGWWNWKEHFDDGWFAKRYVNNGYRLRVLKVIHSPKEGGVHEIKACYGYPDDPEDACPRNNETKLPENTERHEFDITTPICFVQAAHVDGKIQSIGIRTQAGMEFLLGKLPARAGYWTFNGCKSGLTVEAFGGDLWSTSYIGWFSSYWIQTLHLTIRAEEKIL